MTHLGFEEMRPAEVNYVVGQDKVGDPPRPLPASGTSFLKTEGQDVALITWKQAEDGKGTILRLQETAGKPAETLLEWPRREIATAELCSGVEEPLHALPIENGGVQLSFEPFEVLTVRVETR